MLTQPTHLTFEEIRVNGAYYTNEDNNAEINFAYRPFKWTNEKNGKKAQVHCVIIGFSDYKNGKKKKIFMGEGEK